MKIRRTNFIRTEQEQKAYLRNKKYRQNNKDKHNASNLKWADKNRDKLKVRAAIRNAKIRKLVLDHYGRICLCCGETTEQFLTLDHINNDGAEQKRKYGSNIAYYCVKRGYPVDIQILCMNCNFSKGRYGSCPHTKNSNTTSQVIIS